MFILNFLSHNICRYLKKEKKRSIAPQLVNQLLCDTPFVIWYDCSSRMAVLNLCNKWRDFIKSIPVLNVSSSQRMVSRTALISPNITSIRQIISINFFILQKSPLKYLGVCTCVGRGKTNTDAHRAKYYKELQPNERLLDQEKHKNASFLKISNKHLYSIF